ncbi:nucleoplasmin-like protein NO29 [Quercus lobata]|uniref:nucleoplasmin-like protein NO29 n=1 Tax=Quercus lobata TaxID=97700 RepID=UPI0012471B0C|nr:nucleoplasmin-like protein NO29 [Quercus lobata]
MAPKRKSTPSWNPLHFGASSSFSLSYTIPSHVRFHDDKAHKDILENFSQRGIHSKHQVVLSNFSDTDLPIVIHSRGWESLCGISVTCPSVIIQEFYSNMHRFDYLVPLFIANVRGTHIVVTSDIVSKARLCGFVESPSPSLNAPEDEDNDSDSDDDDDDDENEDASSSGDDEMTA